MSPLHLVATFLEENGYQVRPGFTKWETLRIYTALYKPNEPFEVYRPVCDIWIDPHSKGLNLVVSDHNSYIRWFEVNLADPVSLDAILTSVNERRKISGA